MDGNLLLFLLFGAPFVASYAICDSKNRSTAKGIVVTLIATPFCLGWSVSLFLWLGLKKRNPKTGLLY